MEEPTGQGGGMLEGYEKIRSVGRGAYGTAYLYKKTSDSVLVVIKEINMIESTASERQMALNEVQVLSVLNHPNIIRYNRSFEKDGVLMIEMEYADGGTLAHFLSQQTQPMKEQDIILMFRQIVSAIRYMHDHNILHRDLKTANVFLTTDKVIKVGDFGISKVMTTNSHAQTILGTPYYISPEMCEGKQYNQKSDIWALGCVLYEMACLQKTFEGSNLLVLVNKITKGQFQAPTGYSPAFQKLLQDLLRKDPALRPSAAKVDQEIIPLLLNESDRKKSEDLPCAERSFGKNKKLFRSVLYELKSFEPFISITPVSLPSRCQIVQIATSSTHCVALAADHRVFSWGGGTKNQMEQGGGLPLKPTPECVDALRGKNIKIVGAGAGFSAFVSETGMLMTCGDGSSGCLGHGDWNNLAKPRLVEKLMSVDVIAMSCGSHHVVVLSKRGIIYSWGKGRDGRLGLGSEENRSSPSIVNIPKEFVPQTVRCGTDNTAIVTVDGLLLACGSNSYNKLGLNETLFPSFKGHTIKILTPMRVKSISAKVVDVALGPSHTVLLTDDGCVLTLGRNNEGQLGRSYSFLWEQPVVKKLKRKLTTMIQIGPTYSAAGTLDNVIYFWGTRFKDRNISGSSSAIFSLSEGNKLKSTELWNSGRNFSSYEVAGGISPEGGKEISTQPKEILALYASPKQIEKNEIVKLSGIHVFRNNLLILVDTSVPLAKSHLKDDRNDFIANEDADTLGPIPDWIKSELAESVAHWTGYKTVRNPTPDVR